MEVQFFDGVFSATGGGTAPPTFKELTTKLTRTGGPVVGRATINSRSVGPAFAAMCVDIEIDPDTGKSRVLRCTMAQDAGKAIHPSYVEGQMQGGSAQGLGWGLNEEYIYDRDGHPRSFGLLDYRMPTCLDLPEIETIIVEVANPLHLLGIRGVGEVNIVPPPAAAANAVYHAAGVRMTQLPISPPRLLKKLLEQHQAVVRLPPVTSV